MEVARLDGLEQLHRRIYTAHTFGSISHRHWRVKLCDLTKGDVHDFADGLRQDGMSPVMVKKFCPLLVQSFRRQWIAA